MFFNGDDQVSTGVLRVLMTTSQGESDLFMRKEAKKINANDKNFAIAA